MSNGALDFVSTRNKWRTGKHSWETETKSIEFWEKYLMVRAQMVSHGTWGRYMCIESSFIDAAKCNIKPHACVVIVLTTRVYLEQFLHIGMDPTAA